MASIDDLPDEIVHQILLYVSPEETLTKVSLLSRRFNRVAQEPLLWKFYCQRNFKYWESNHHFKERLRRNLRDTDWKRLYLQRLGRNARIARLVESKSITLSFLSCYLIDAIVRNSLTGVPILPV